MFQLGEKVRLNMNYGLGSIYSGRQIQTFYKNRINYVDKIKQLDKWIMEDKLQQVSEDLFNIEGIEIIEELNKKGKGYIAASAHLSHWVALPLVLAYRGLQFSLLHEAISSRYRDKYLDAGIKLIRGNKKKKDRTHKLSSKKQNSYNTFSRILGLVKCNNVMGVMFDIYREKGINITLVNKKIRVVSHYLVLAYRLKVPIVPVFMICSGKNQFNIKIYPALPVRVGQSFREYARSTARILFDRLEELIIEYPEQYLWSKYSIFTKSDGYFQDIVSLIANSE